MIKKGQLGEDAVMPSRKRLDHRGPLAIDISSAWYFITICAEGHRPWVMLNPDGRAGAPRTPHGTCTIRCRWSGITKNNANLHLPIS